MPNLSQRLESVPVGSARHNCRDGYDRRDLAAVSIESAVDAVLDAVRDQLGLTMRASQIAAGRRLMSRAVVELPTGEGKTIATMIPATAFARRRRKVWIATANDYLAARDATAMRPVYQRLGISVSYLDSATTGASIGPDKNEAYRADVVYGTLRSFGFDHLKDLVGKRLARSTSPSNTARLETADCAEDAPFAGDVLIVDEADSLLIDEARTPMLISAPRSSSDPATDASIKWAAVVATTMTTKIDFHFDPAESTVALTAAGRRRALFREMPTAMRSLSTTDMLHVVELAILANQTIFADVHYVVEENRIKLVDEYTGRKSDQRTLGGGLHQAIEAREGLALTPLGITVGRITTQDFVSKFNHVCGLTATAWEDRHELRDVYDLSMHVVAPEKPSRGLVWSPRYFLDADAKRRAIVEETFAMIGAGRAVLIGTRTIRQSEMLSRQFRQAGIEHQLLTARNLECEAQIVAGAGQSGHVTIATNLAGRGTDITLSDETRAAGGLHVILSEPHGSSRIDRQLIGRGARCGDPGTSRLFGSADDEILVRAFGPEKVRRLKTRASRKRSMAPQELAESDGTSVDSAGAEFAWLGPYLRRAQNKVTRAHRAERVRLTLVDTHLADAMRKLGLDPHLDPLPAS